jgi:hypothetical protein
VVEVEGRQKAKGTVPGNKEVNAENRSVCCLGVFRSKEESEPEAFAPALGFCGQRCVAAQNDE